MGRGSRPFETPQTSRSRSHPDICPTKGAGGGGVTARAGDGGHAHQTNAREQRFVSCSGLGFSSGEGTAAASCRPGRARNRDTLLLEAPGGLLETQPPHRSARREPGNHLLLGEERRLPARWSAKPPLGRRLGGIC